MFLPTIVRIVDFFFLIISYVTEAREQSEQIVKLKTCILRQVVLYNLTVTHFTLIVKGAGEDFHMVYNNMGESEKENNIRSMINSLYLCVHEFFNQIRS